MSGDDIGEVDLLAYVDGLLDPARRRAVEDYLASHSDAARRVAADMVIAAGIRDLYAGTYEEDPPDRLAETLRPVPPRDWRRGLALTAAAVVLVSMGALGGWWTADDMPGEHLVQQLMDGTLPNGNLIPASAKPADTPLTWFIDAVRRELRAPDLRAQGFELVGEALAARGSRPVVRLTYADRDGRRVDLFVEPRWDKDLPMRQHDAGGRLLLAWGHGPAMFALTGSVSADDLRTLAAAIQTANDGGDPAVAESSIKPVAEVPIPR